MYAQLFRNRLFALAWVLLMLGGALLIATRSLSGGLSPDEPEQAVTGQDRFSQWAAQEPPAPPADEAEEAQGRKVEVRIYHDRPADTANDPDAPDQGPDQPESPDQNP
ncbi:hypothetical protein [Novosphingobium cyanobacteriorum]|uniref:Uncharacterized protein n=1 Tax=Novosphingobium cyanobacteriorum TaxID=3024215 RepID=A0ABT6CHX8_9SPHN|nr:hypothetical protein [Novosphingobium cyanobacteriorum]MDF8333113.1 hypothetical protein [Novosphingobium cyanobacteriorum]